MQITRDCEKSSFKRNEGFILFHAQDLHKTVWSRKVSELKFLLKPLSDNTEQTGKIARNRSVARKETLGVHQKNWVCHIYCQINAQKKTKKQACLLGINMLV